MHWVEVTGNGIESEIKLWGYKKANERNPACERREGNDDGEGWQKVGIGRNNVEKWRKK